MDLVINRYRSGVKTYNKTSLADASGFSALRKIVFMLWWPLRAATKFTIDSMPLYHAILRHGVLCCWYSCWLSISKHHIENPTQCCNFFFFFFCLMQQQSHTVDNVSRNNIPEGYAGRRAGPPHLPADLPVREQAWSGWTRKKTHLKVVIGGSLCRSACLSGAVSLSFC